MNFYSEIKIQNVGGFIYDIFSAYVFITVEAVRIKKKKKCMSPLISSESYGKSFREMEWKIIILQPHTFLHEVL